MSKKTLPLICIAMFAALALVGCKNNETDAHHGDRPQAEHPEGEHPQGEHPTTDHPAGEHPQGEHPSRN